MISFLCPRGCKAGVSKMVAAIEKVFKEDTVHCSPRSPWVLSTCPHPRLPPARPHISHASFQVLESVILLPGVALGLLLLLCLEVQELKEPGIFRASSFPTSGSYPMTLLSESEGPAPWLGLGQL